ncbi:hypothetical protein [Marinobacter shengliensis]|uniref:hypothetical protein n=1 Tax=Marinobacter shengliensis TaxID=1389223 RepID=UPI000D106750|nr:hypothetical protein [Marinobacter shengliensis]PSF14264.1 hypothetical protein C7H10_06110 [Marinobacter shengliensis]
MFKPILFVLVVSLLAGCASTRKWESSYEEYKNSVEMPEIEVRMTTDHFPGIVRTTWQHNIQVFVDNSLALQTPIHEDYSGSLLFFYEQDRFEMECVKPNFYSFSECEVQVNGRRAGKVSFGN